MIVSDVIDRLRENCPIFEGRVFTSVELSTMTQSSARLPCAFVVLMSEKADSNSLIGGYSQKVTAQFGVVICVKNFKDARTEGQESLEIARQEVKDALCNYEIPETAIPVEFVQGQLAAYDNALMRWNDVFTTQFYYRK